MPSAKQPLSYYWLPTIKTLL
ncbi:hypothetical protein EMIT0P44_400047 [Pseudomonas sp. IT-P44]